MIRNYDGLRRELKSQGRPDKSIENTIAAAKEKEKFSAKDKDIDREIQEKWQWKISRQSLVEKVSRLRELEEQKFDSLRREMEKQGFTDKQIDDYVRLERKKANVVKNENRIKEQLMEDKIKKIQANQYLSKENKENLVAFSIEKSCEFFGQLYTIF